MLRFNREQTEKYKKSNITGTGYLAFRDINFGSMHNRVNSSLYTHDS